MYINIIVVGIVLLGLTQQQVAAVCTKNNANAVGKITLVADNPETDGTGRTVIKKQQMYKGLVVKGFTGTFDKADGSLILGKFAHCIKQDLPTVTPAICPLQAYGIAKKKAVLYLKDEINGATNVVFPVEDRDRVTFDTFITVKKEKAIIVHAMTLTAIVETPQYPYQMEPFVYVEVDANSEQVVSMVVT